MSMRYDGVLLCTDFDGTLACGGKISRENEDAIRYFKENGGRFTVISGREPKFIADLHRHIIPNAPICGMNGAWITDEAGKNVLFEAPMNNEAVRYSIDMLSQLPGVQELHIQQRSAVYKTRVENAIPLSSVPAFYEDIFKILYIISDDESDTATDILQKNAGSRYAVSRSWKNGLEFQQGGSDKGSAVRFLKDHFGGRITYTVGVGDYENDIPLLLASDLKIAERDAIPKIKAIADRVTSSCRDDSIAHVIYSL